MTTLQFAIRLAIAILLGSAIGIERQWRQKSAGLRTNTLVSLGSAAFVLVAINIGGDATGRVASYIVSGIGFLGAGAIMKDGLNVQGLNTAATIWCSAAVGSLAGLGQPGQAAVTAGAIIFTHIMLRPLSIKLSNVSLFPKSETTQTDYVISIKCKETVENHLRVLLMQHLGNDDKLMLRSLSSSDNGEPTNAIIIAEIITVGKQDYLMEKMASRITIEKDVTKVSWEVVGHQSDI